MKWILLFLPLALQPSMGFGVRHNPLHCLTQSSQVFYNFPSLRQSSARPGCTLLGPIQTFNLPQINHPSNAYVACKLNYLCYNILFFHNTFLHFSSPSSSTYNFGPHIRCTCLSDICSLLLHTVLSEWNEYTIKRIRRAQLTGRQRKETIVWTRIDLFESRLNYIDNRCGFEPPNLVTLLNIASE